MTLVVDASVAVKWVVLEDARDEALEQAAGRELVAPEFVLTEVSSILWKKVRTGQLPVEQAQQGLAFVRSAFVKMLPTRLLTDRAFAMAISLDHPVYDCLYLATAEVENAALLTADRRLAQQAMRLGTVATHLIGASI